jgi:hypothetical protein
MKTCCALTALLAAAVLGWGPALSLIGGLLLRLLSGLAPLFRLLGLS